MKTASLPTFVFLLLSTMGAWAQQAPILAVDAAIGSPAAIAADASGNVYFVSNNNNRVFKVDQNGILTTVAGTSVAGYSGDGGLATNAELNGPMGLAVDSAGNLYIADSANNRVRRVSPSGVIATVAGNGTPGYSGDGGPAADAELNSPTDLAIDGSGNLYISHYVSIVSVMFDTVVRKVSQVTGIIATAAGGCPPDSCVMLINPGVSATEVELSGTAIAVDEAGTLYVCGNYTLDFIDEFSPAGTFVTSFDGVLGPTNVAVDRAGNLYMVDGCQVYSVYITGYVNPAYELMVVAGNGQCSYSGDGGLAVNAGISPAAIAFDGAGNLYIADSGNQRVRKVSSDSGIITTIAGATGLAISAVVSGASFLPGIVPNSWVTIYGTNLSPVTDYWTVVTGQFPTQVDGVSVSVSGQPAYVEYVSSGQINVLAPDTGTGTMQVTITNELGTTPAFSATSAIYGPAFFLWANQYAVATYTDYNYAVKNGAIGGVTTVPPKPGDVVILWGTGFGPTTPVAPPGEEVPANAIYSTTDNVTITIGEVPATVYSAVLSPGFAGLYQVAIQIPLSLANGDYPVVATVNGTQSPDSTLITIQQ